MQDFALAGICLDTYFGHTESLSFRENVHIYAYNSVTYCLWRILVYKQQIDVCYSKI